MAGKAIIHIKLKSMKLRSKLFSSCNYMESKYVLPGIQATQKVTVSRREPGGQAAPLRSPAPPAPQQRRSAGAHQRWAVRKHTPRQSCLARPFSSICGSLFAFRSLPSFLSERLSWLSHLLKHEPALKQGCSVW